MQKPFEEMSEEELIAIAAQYQQDPSHGWNSEELGKHNVYMAAVGELEMREHPEIREQRERMG